MSMIADLDGAEALYGERGYRYAHVEAGALGQRLYVAAEALGLRATGIGAFFDDRVRTYLELEAGQVVYHFAIGIRWWILGWSFDVRDIGLRGQSFHCGGAATG
jgi:nitroreductase